MSILEQKKNSLMHYGIKDMVKGVRRWQNEDGTFNEEGKKRYFGYKGDDKKALKIQERLEKNNYYLNINNTHIDYLLKDIHKKDPNFSPNGTISEVLINDIPSMVYQEGMIFISALGSAVALPTLGPIASGVISGAGLGLALVPPKTKKSQASDAIYVQNNLNKKQQKLMNKMDKYL